MGLAHRWSLGATLLLSACSTQPVFTHIEGDPFTHMAQFKSGEGRTLHVYIEGDGRPWLGPGRINADPTPRHLLMWHLAQKDPSPTLYLGRPCYHGLSHTPPCTALHWTHRRYSEEVVQSMAQAIVQLWQPDQWSEIWLIGHSGGGTLAMLMAPRIGPTTRVITLAGNLNVALWAQQHGHSPLTGSLNPAQQQLLSDAIQQIHLVGDQDHNTFAATIQGVACKQPMDQLWLLSNQDHHCCWQTILPSILNGEMPLNGMQICPSVKETTP